MTSTPAMKCDCNGPYTCKVHGGEYRYCSDFECICHAQPVSHVCGVEVMSTRVTKRPEGSLLSVYENMRSVCKNSKPCALHPTEAPEPTADGKPMFNGEHEKNMTCGGCGAKISFIHLQDYTGNKCTNCSPDEEALEDKEGKGWEVGLEAIRQEYHYMKSADRVNFNQLFYKLRTLLAQVAEESREKALEEAEAVVGNVRRFKEARFDSQPFFTGWNESLDVAQSDLAALKKN